LFIFQSGFDVALEVLAQVAEVLKGKRSCSPRRPGQAAPLPLMRVTWVCQRLPGPELMAALNAATTSAEGVCNMAMALYVCPPQVRQLVQDSIAICSGLKRGILIRES